MESKRKRSTPTTTTTSVKGIEGLEVHNAWISEIEEKGLLAFFQENDFAWSNTISRRTIHYGCRYVYKTKTLADAPAIPSWLEGLTRRVKDECGFEEDVNQIIVNEYCKGQGIAPHIDHIMYFGNRVATLTLGYAVPIRFECDGECVNVEAPRRSLMLLSGESRYKWKHSLKMNGPASTPRVSVTFRHAFTEGVTVIFKNPFGDKAGK